jgi:hypothetical protein
MADRNGAKSDMDYRNWPDIENPLPVEAVA